MMKIEKIIRKRNNNGEIYWYNEKGKYIHWKDSNVEYWNEFDEYGILIYSKNSKGEERWHDEKGHEICEKFNGCEY